MIQIFKMQRIRKTIFILASLLTAVLCLIAICYSSNKESQRDPFPDVRLPIHTDAQYQAIKKRLPIFKTSPYVQYAFVLENGPIPPLWRG